MFCRHAAFATFCITFAAPAWADSAMLAAWDQYDLAYAKETRLKSCTNTRDTGPDGAEMVACLEFVCSPDLGLRLEVQVKGLTPGGPFPGTLAVDGTALAEIALTIPDAPGLPVASGDAAAMLSVLDAMTRGTSLAVTIDHPFLSGVTGLASYPLEQAAGAVPKFLAGCPSPQGGAAAAAEPDAPAAPAPEPAPEPAAMFRPWGMERANGDRVFLKSCSGATEAAPWGGGAFAPCIDVTCDPATGLFLTVAVPNDGDPKEWQATVYAEGRDKGRFTFRLRPEVPGFHSAQMTPDEARALLEDLAGSSSLSVLFRDSPLKELQTLRGYPMDRAAAAIPEFLAACPLLNGAATAAPEPSLPSFAVEETPPEAAAAPAEPETPALPSFDIAAETPAEDTPALPSFTVEGTATVDPSQAPPGVIPGMPLTFVPDPAAPPATPAEDAARFVTVTLAAIPDQTGETVAQAMLGPQQIDFAARFGGVPVISGDLVVFTDGRLILAAVFCVAGKTGDDGCETWLMTTTGGGAPFGVSARGLPSDRPLWIDLKGPGTDGWPDLLVQDAAGAWTRFGWNGTGYF